MMNVVVDGFVRLLSLVENVSGVKQGNRAKNGILPNPAWDF